MTRREWYRAEAARIRREAERIANERVRREMLKIADNYDRLAQQLEDDE